MGFYDYILYSTNQVKESANSVLHFTQKIEGFVIPMKSIIEYLEAKIIKERQIKVLKTKEITLGLSWNEGDG